MSVTTIPQHMWTAHTEIQPQCNYIAPGAHFVPYGIGESLYSLRVSV